MNALEKQYVLTQLYEIYDSYIASQNLACHEKCAGCCTINVTMTSVEGKLVHNYLTKHQGEEVFNTLQKAAEGKRFQPLTTPNGMVASLMKGQTPPEETPSNPDWGKCPLLINDSCSVYANRPFECRSFVSKINCNENAQADMSNEIIAVNNMFKQYIEHVDDDGVSGNLVDILIYTETKVKHALIGNQPVPMLMTDPEHKDVLDPLIEKIQNIKIKK